MYTLHLDLVVIFCPPMPDGHHGITFTRELQLPFPPAEGTCIYSREMDELPDPMGWMLKDVVWDMDRRVFLASVYFQPDTPIALIPQELQRFIDLGWKLGSFRDAYKVEYPKELMDEAAGRGDPDPYETAEVEQRLTWKDRDEESNRVCRAMIRFLVEHYMSESSAYASDKTGRFFHEHELERGRGTDPAVDEFLSCRHDYEQMTEKKREKWEARVAKYPSIAELLQPPGDPAKNRAWKPVSP